MDQLILFARKALIFYRRLARMFLRGIAYVLKRTP